MAGAQGLTGALIGTVKDAQGGVLSGAVVRVNSPALIGGPATLTTNEKGQLRFPALPPDTAGDGLASDNLFSPTTFGQPIIFMDPRRAMVSVRVNLGR
jgi:hypothetical protein